jgi:hypothetical protein
LLHLPDGTASRSPNFKPLSTRVARVPGQVLRTLQLARTASPAAKFEPGQHPVTALHYVHLFDGGDNPFDHHLVNYGCRVSCSSSLHAASKAWPIARIVASSNAPKGMNGRTDSTPTIPCAGTPTCNLRRRNGTGIRKTMAEIATRRADRR